MSNDPAYKYALSVINKEIRAPKYIKLQCKEFIKIWEDKDDTYKINRKLLNKIYKILKVLKMAKGPCVNKSIYSSLAGYQWLLVTASMCTVKRDDPRKRRYETILLEIARKNGKTFIVGVLLILLFYLEPSFSRFFSVAPDGALAKEIKEAIDPLIKVNADVFEDGEFKILRDSITHILTQTRYMPLNYSTQRMDGKEPNVFIADEIGALPNSYAIEAMQSGQLLVNNRLGFLISTKYPSAHNPLEDEVEMAKKVLDGLVKKDTLFALLYEPDNVKDWTNDDDILKDSNPLALEREEVWNELLDRRTRAVAMESARENFLTKHCNIIYQGAGTETYIPVDQVQKCKIDNIDWKGRNVYVGVDLAQTNDNCAVAIASIDDDNNILADVMAFIPEARIDEKNQFEKLDYREYIRNKNCIACGDMTVDYGTIEKYVFDLEEKLRCNIVAIGYDRYNAMSSVQKWNDKFTTIEIRQHSDTLHPPTKLLSEKIANGEFRYTKNKLLEINFENARCTYDTNMNRYVNKKKSNGKVDMVVSLIDAVYLLQQDIIFGDDFVVQTF